jgi:hypothetical protein
MSIERLSTEQLLSLQSCAQRLFLESRADLKLLYAAALRGIREEMKCRLETNDFRDDQDWATLKFPEYVLRNAKLEALEALQL